MDAMGLPDDLWRHHRDLALECSRQMEPSDQRHLAVPPPYCNAYCLDNNSSGLSSHGTQQQQRGRRTSFGYPSVTFKVTSREDGHLYCLRRFDSVKSVSPKIAAAVSDEHPGIVPFYRCLVGPRAVVFFVHHYVPGARTLQERLFVLGGRQPLSEPVLWSCIAQLVSAVATIHGNNLAVRTLRLPHILSQTDSTSSRLRLRLNCLGIIDALEFESRKHVADLQREDIRDLGRLILSLATGTEIASGTDEETVGNCEAFLAQNYSRELHNLTMTLIRSVPRPPSIVDVSRAIAQRSFDEQDAVYRSLDRSERALSAEYESGRVLRLLLKLGFVNERPEFGPNRRWSQSGDCYMLKLFRDYGRYTS
jgi:PAB-dependent poly(A)-specific ribonuclease subunit 3